MILVNLHAGPGSGKSTLAMLIAADIKTRSPATTVEYVDEFAKRLVWEGRIKTIRNRPLVLGEQHERLACLEGKVDIAITDSPLLLNIAYARREGWPAGFDEVVLHLCRRFQAIDVFVHRPSRTAYETRGRNETLAESLALDEEILRLVELHGSAPIRFATPDGPSARAIADLALARLAPGAGGWAPRAQPLQAQASAPSGA